MNGKKIMKVLITMTILSSLLLFFNIKAYAKMPKYLGKATIKAKKKSNRRKRFKEAFTISHIGKKVIKATNNPMQGIVNILNQKPSIFASSRGPNGVMTDIEMRAFQSNQITEEFDGIPLNALFENGAQNFGGVSNNVPFTLGDISSINIYRGVNKPSVNSYNSLGGTINFSPLMPSIKRSGSIFGGYGSFATRQYGFDINTGKLPGNIYLYLRATRNNSNGYVDNTSGSNHSYYLSLIKFYNEGRSNINFLYLRNDTSNYNPHEMPLSLEQQYGPSLGYPLNVDWSKHNNTSWYAILGINNYVSRHFSFSNKLFYHVNRTYRTTYSNLSCYPGYPSYANINSGSYPLYDPAVSSECSSFTTLVNGSLFMPYYPPNSPHFGVTSSSTGDLIDPAVLFPGLPAWEASAYATSYRIYVQTYNEIGDLPSLSIKLPRNKITLGGQFFDGTIHTTLNWGPNTDTPAVFSYAGRFIRSIDAVYAQDKISIIPKRLFIEPGLKYNIIRSTVDDYLGYSQQAGNLSNTYNYFEPTIGISYMAIPNLNIYASYGRTEKVPNHGGYLTALQVCNTSNTYCSSVPMTVKPEYIDDFELGARYKIDNLYLFANGYKEDFQNTFAFYSPITGPYAGDSFEYNIGNSVYEGVELGGKYNFNRHLGMFANYSFNTGTYTSSYMGNYGSVLAGEHIAKIPRHLANIGAFAKILSTYARLWGTYTGLFYLNDINGNPTGQFHLGGFFVLNGYISHYFNFRKFKILKEAQLKGVKLSLSIDNILNRTYYPQASTNTFMINNQTYTYFGVYPGLPRFVMLNASFKF